MKVVLLTDYYLRRVMGQGIAAGYKVFFKIDWSHVFIQILEMTWYCCDKLWTLFTNRYLLKARRE